MRDSITGFFRRSGAGWLALGLAACPIVGCVSAKVQTGAAVGALSGAAAGAGVGVLITDEDLLGSSASPETGDTSLPRGGGIAASIAVGAVVGAIVGAMVGHQQEHPYDDRKLVPVAPPTGDDELEADAEARVQAPRAF
jgi:hypothetical protein